MKHLSMTAVYLLSPSDNSNKMRLPFSRLAATHESETPIPSERSHLTNVDWNFEQQGGFVPVRWWRLVCTQGTSVALATKEYRKRVMSLQLIEQSARCLLMALSDSMLESDPMVQVMDTDEIDWLNFYQIYFEPCRLYWWNFRKQMLWKQSIYLPWEIVELPGQKQQEWMERMTWPGKDFIERDARHFERNRKRE